MKSAGWSWARAQGCRNVLPFEVGRPSQAAMRQNGDYKTQREEMFEGSSVADIANEIRARRKSADTQPDARADVRRQAAQVRRQASQPTMQESNR